MNMVDESPEDLVELGRQLLADGKPQEALGAFERAIVGP